VRGLGVVGAHPPEEGEHLLGVPRPDVEPREHGGCVSLAGEDVLVDGERFGEGGLDAEDGEALLRREVLQQPVLELEEFARAPWSQGFSG
jgi:hypothetical protein